ncbi:MAG: cobyrinate a,c-diamide synthase [Bacteroidales bacterium]|nr:cobyrinate a,c-diamide synthase [Bacteroidales bacterium]
MIAGTNSGCGKTTITIGLMALLKDLKLNVAPFKTGPDYIDPRFHEFVSGVSSYNLDSYLMSPAVIHALFHAHSKDCDVAVVEGVMGLYDGMGEEATGSSYELAKTLRIPIILTINCMGLYQSVVAIVKGYCSMQPDNLIVGVILNQVANKQQYEFLKLLIEKECKVKCIGYLPPLKEISLESRHLGLVQAAETKDLLSKITLLTSTLHQTIDVETLLKSTLYSPSINENTILETWVGHELKGLNLAVAHDEAFLFYYADNLELLQHCGATLHYFSPLRDKEVPAHCHAVYIGGGYPEVFAETLSSNKSMLKSIRDKAECGTPIYAECGGLMYLTQAIETLENEQFEMCGVFNCRTQMTTKLQRFGYAEIGFDETTSRCHEFHSSTLVEPDNKNYSKKFSLRKPETNISWTCGLSYKNVLAGYAHIHFMSNKDFSVKLFQLLKLAL